jgi:quinolinate synthase
VANTFTEPEPSPLLLLLGEGQDPLSERGVDCPGGLPAPSDPDLVRRARAARDALGDRAFILGHHYQRDEVIEFADVTGDSFKLAQKAAARPDSEFIVFCGVHFMAESADILTNDDQIVVLPDMAAGCSMADMAAADQVVDAWRTLEAAGVANVTIPVTYMNSTAAIKAFTGEHGGTICTSSNAEQSLRWAFEQGEKVLFLPDQHLGRNTAVLDLDMDLADCVVFDPHKPGGGLTPQQLADARMILWRGHCSVHGRFTEESVDEIRAKEPGVNVLVHPECQHEVVLKADYVGSTEYIIKTLAAAEPWDLLGHRHRVEPGAEAGRAAPRQAHHVPRPHHLLLLDDEPHRPAAPGVGAGESGGGPDRQPDRRRPGHCPLGPRRAGSDAGAARGGRGPQRLMVAAHIR